MNYKKKELLYENHLCKQDDVRGFVLEGQAEIAFPRGRLQIRNTMKEEKGQAANIVYWCPEYFPDCIEISWDFYPLSAKGLCVFFFSAMGRNGTDIFHSSLAKRTGEYDWYHSGDINAFHISYYRRMYESERAFQIANLRKSYGFHLVAQGADPLPYPSDARPPYGMKVIKYKEKVEFFIDDLPILNFTDPGVEFGEILTGGMLGFRQMSPMVGEYANLQIYRIEGK